MSSYKIEIRLSTPSTRVMATVEEESEWCNWITWILAEVVDFCFGPKTCKAGLQDAKSGWKILLQKVEMWETNKPKTFLPVAVNERDLEKGRRFPELWYGSGWHGLFYPVPIISSLLTTVSDDKHAFSDSSFLLDVYDPLTRNISIGEFGFLRARQQLEVRICVRIYD